MSASIPLVHTWDNQKIVPRTGLFPIGDGTEIPKAWELLPNQYDPRALPTPFARAEATRLALVQIDHAKEHPLVLQFQWLLLGIASGVLSVEPQDLASPAFDNLGKALLNVGEDVRYFSRLVWRERTLTFGATDPTCLVWSHARRTQAEWDALAQAVQPLHTRALTVLADWRELIHEAGRWNRERAAWQRGVDHVLGDAKGSAGHEDFHKHATTVGPVRLDLPTQDADAPLQREALYLPASETNFADTYVKLCNFQPVPTPGAIEFRDGQNKTIGRISLPSVGADSDATLLGMGTLESVDRVSPRVPMAEQRLWVQAKGGLVEQLQPLSLALSQRGRPLTPSLVNATPFYYPDSVRVLFQRGYWPDTTPGAKRERLTGRAELLLASKGMQLPSGIEVEAEGGAVAALGTGEGAFKATFLDQFNGVDVLDLRALGLVLFRVFVGSAEAGSAGNIEDAESLAPLLLHTLEHPLEAHPEVYRAVAGAAPPDIGKQLATLQRLVGAYSAASPANSVARVLERAAKSYASWAFGRTVIGLGRKPIATESIRFRLPTGTELSLAKDPVNSGSASSR